MNEGSATDVQAARPRVLVLSAYPVRHPHHGGQIRVREIIEAYRSAGLDVRHASAFPDHDGYLRAGIDPGDIALPASRLQHWRGHAVPYVEDLASGDDLAQHPDLLARIERHVGGPLALLHFEQPWLLPAVLALRERGRLGAFALCHGSQNVETELRVAMWRAAGISNIDTLVDAIGRLEQQAVRVSQVVAAVTEHDRQILQSWASPDTAVVLAGNGIKPWHAGQALLARWRERLVQQGVDLPFALYVGSDHPPNIHGFGQSFGASLATLPPGRHIVVAGRVGPAIAQTDWYRRNAGVNASRMAVLGPLADADLDALRTLAHAFILPVTSGGGSNLKTAEALHAGCHVVATPTALRGFEPLLPWAGLRVAEPGAAFAQAVREVLAQAPRAAGDHDPRREQLTWAQQLAPLAKAVAAVAAVAAQGLAAPRLIHENSCNERDRIG